jgi:hypothetical protein
LVSILATCGHGEINIVKNLTCVVIAHVPVASRKQIVASIMFCCNNDLCELFSCILWKLNYFYHFNCWYDYTLGSKLFSYSATKELFLEEIIKRGSLGVEYDKLGSGGQIVTTPNWVCLGG